ncbi:hypothetical protein EVAR_31547_1 [Eumeta japonica]|uniref:Uncharacterized protein n=1 Tax=Eumeta variegata TaxID=151549 RepID=A0A4C1V752_EUMVA|nr:hypothetical protein EVAR_31547_1 [Eumeta japonica]
MRVHQHSAFISITNTPLFECWKTSRMRRKRLQAWARSDRGTTGRNLICASSQIVAYANWINVQPGGAYAISHLALVPSTRFSVIPTHKLFLSSVIIKFSWVRRPRAPPRRRLSDQMNVRSAIPKDSNGSVTPPLYRDSSTIRMRPYPESNSFDID